MMRIKGLNRKLRLSRWAIVCLAVVVALTSVGVTYARMKGPKPPKYNPPVSTATCSDPFTWVATNDDGHLDYRDIFQPPDDPIDPGDDGIAGEYDYWGPLDTSSSNDPGSYPAPGAPPAPGDNFSRYTKDVARTTAEIDEADPEYIDVLIENAYPYYYSTVFFTLECPESRQGWVRDFVIEALEDDPLNPTLEALTITTSLLEIDQPMPSGGEVMGALHILVTQDAPNRLATYKFRLTIYTDCGIRTCGTAYAYGGPPLYTDPNYAICFIDMPELKNASWGWTNGPLGPGSYEFPLYAGAGGCDITGLEPAGMLTIVYGGGTATITYNMDTGYTMDDTHLYVGSDILPTRKDVYTVSPGQYPYSHTLDYAKTDEYTITGLSGTIYVVAHAVVGWLE